jgi:hypothetical protein
LISIEVKCLDCGDEGWKSWRITGGIPHVKEIGGVAFLDLVKLTIS